MNETDPNAAGDLPPELIDLKPPMDIPDPWGWVPWTLGLIVALAILVPLVIWLLRKMQMADPVTPPAERARQKLAEARGIMGQPGPFCVVVSHTLRVYLEERFGLNTPGQSTEEFLEAMKTSPVLKEHHQAALTDFLRQCDLVKFARHELAEEELENLHQAAGHFIDETAVVATAPPGAEPPVITPPADAEPPVITPVPPKLQ